MNQMMYLNPPVEEAQQSLLQELFSWESVLLSLPRIQHSRYQVRVLHLHYNTPATRYISSPPSVLHLQYNTPTTRYVITSQCVTPAIQHSRYQVRHHLSVCYTCNTTLPLPGMSSPLSVLHLQYNTPATRYVITSQCVTPAIQHSHYQVRLHLSVCYTCNTTLPLPGMSSPLSVLHLQYNTPTTRYVITSQCVTPAIQHSHYQVCLHLSVCYTCNTTLPLPGMSSPPSVLHLQYNTPTTRYVFTSQCVTPAIQHSRYQVCLHLSVCYTCNTTLPLPGTSSPLSVLHLQYNTPTTRYIYSPLSVLHLQYNTPTTRYISSPPSVLHLQYNTPATRYVFTSQCVTPAIQHSRYQVRLHLSVCYTCNTTLPLPGTSSPLSVLHLQYNTPTTRYVFTSQCVTPAIQHSRYQVRLHLSVCYTCNTTLPLPGTSSPLSVLHLQYNTPATRYVFTSQCVTPAIQHSRYQVRLHLPVCYTCNTTLPLPGTSSPLSVLHLQYNTPATRYIFTSQCVTPAIQHSRYQVRHHLSVCYTCNTTLPLPGTSSPLSVLHLQYNTPTTRYVFTSQCVTPAIQHSRYQVHLHLSVCYTCNTTLPLPGTSSPPSVLHLQYNTPATRYIFTSQCVTPAIQHSRYQVRLHLSVCYTCNTTLPLPGTSSPLSVLHLQYNTPATRYIFTSQCVTPAIQHSRYQVRLHLSVCYTCNTTLPLPGTSSPLSVLHLQYNTPATRYIFTSQCVTPAIQHSRYQVRLHLSVCYTCNTTLPLPGTSSPLSVLHLQYNTPATRYVFTSQCVTPAIQHSRYQVHLHLSVCYTCNTTLPLPGTSSPPSVLHLQYNTPATRYVFTSQCVTPAIQHSHYQVRLHLSVCYTCNTTLPLPGTSSPLSVLHLQYNTPATRYVFTSQCVTPAIQHSRYQVRLHLSVCYTCNTTLPLPGTSSPLSVLHLQYNTPTTRYIFTSQCVTPAIQHSRYQVHLHLSVCYTCNTTLPLPGTSSPLSVLHLQYNTPTTRYVFTSQCVTPAIQHSHYQVHLHLSVCYTCNTTLPLPGTSSPLSVLHLQYNTPTTRYIFTSQCVTPAIQHSRYQVRLHLSVCYTCNTTLPLPGTSSPLSVLHLQYNTPATRYIFTSQCVTPAIQHSRYQVRLHLSVCYTCNTTLPLPGTSSPLSVLHLQYNTPTTRYVFTSQCVTPAIQHSRYQVRLHLSVCYTCNTTLPLPGTSSPLSVLHLQYNTPATRYIFTSQCVTPAIQHSRYQVRLHLSVCYTCNTTLPLPGTSSPLSVLHLQYNTPTTRYISSPLSVLHLQYNTPATRYVFTSQCVTPAIQHSRYQVHLITSQCVTPAIQHSRYQVHLHLSVCYTCNTTLPLPGTSSPLSVLHLQYNTPTTRYVITSQCVTPAIQHSRYQVHHHLSVCYTCNTTLPLPGTSSPLSVLHLQYNTPATRYVFTSQCVTPAIQHSRYQVRHHLSVCYTCNTTLPLPGTSTHLSVCYTCNTTLPLPGTSSPLSVLHLQYNTPATRYVFTSQCVTPAIQHSRYQVRLHLSVCYTCNTTLPLPGTSSPLSVLHLQYNTPATRYISSPLSVLHLQYNIPATRYVFTSQCVTPAIQHSHYQVRLHLSVCYTCNTTLPLPGTSSPLSVLHLQYNTPTTRYIFTSQCVTPAIQHSRYQVRLHLSVCYTCNTTLPLPGTSSPLSVLHLQYNTPATRYVFTSQCVTPAIQHSHYQVHLHLSVCYTCNTTLPLPGTSSPLSVLHLQYNTPATRYVFTSQCVTPAIQHSHYQVRLHLSVCYTCNTTLPLPGTSSPLSVLHLQYNTPATRYVFTSQCVTPAIQHSRYQVRLHLSVCYTCNTTLPLPGTSSPLSVLHLQYNTPATRYVFTSQCVTPAIQHSRYQVHLHLSVCYTCNTTLPLPGTSHHLSVCYTCNTTLPLPGTSSPLSVLHLQYNTPATRYISSPPSVLHLQYNTPATRYIFTSQCVTPAIQHSHYQVRLHLSMCYTCNTTLPLPGTSSPLSVLHLQYNIPATRYIITSQCVTPAIQHSRYQVRHHLSVCYTCNTTLPLPGTSSPLSVLHLQYNIPATRYVITSQCVTPAIQHSHYQVHLLTSQCVTPAIQHSRYQVRHHLSVCYTCNTTLPLPGTSSPLSVLHLQYNIPATRYVFTSQCVTPAIQHSRYQVRHHLSVCYTCNTTLPLPGTSPHLSVCYTCNTTFPLPGTSSPLSVLHLQYNTPTTRYVFTSQCVTPAIQHSRYQVRHHLSVCYTCNTTLPLPGTSSPLSVLHLQYNTPATRYVITSQCVTPAIQHSHYQVRHHLSVCYTCNTTPPLPGTSTHLSVCYTCNTTLPLPGTSTHLSVCYTCNTTLPLPGTSTHLSVCYTCNTTLPLPGTSTHLSVCYTCNTTLPLPGTSTHLSVCYTCNTTLPLPGTSHHLPVCYTCNTTLPLPGTSSPLSVLHLQYNTPATRYVFTSQCVTPAIQHSRYQVRLHLSVCYTCNTTLPLPGTSSLLSVLHLQYNTPATRYVFTSQCVTPAIQHSRYQVHLITSQCVTPAIQHSHYQVHLITSQCVTPAIQHSCYQVRLHLSVCYTCNTTLPLPGTSHHLPVCYTCNTTLLLPGTSHHLPVCYTCNTTLPLPGTSSPLSVLHLQYNTPTTRYVFTSQCVTPAIQHSRYQVHLITSQCVTPAIQHSHYQVHLITSQCVTPAIQHSHYQVHLITSQCVTPAI